MPFVLLHSAKLDLASGDLPKRLVVLPWGENQTVSAGNVTVNSTTLGEMPANQAALNFDRVALDFNHNTVPGTQWYKGEPAKVAGYATPRVIDGEGLVFDDIDWTPDGTEHVGGRHYIDLSAAVKTNDRGEVIFCHSAGVCRQGQVRGLHILATDPFDKLRTGPFEPQPNHTLSMDADKLKALLVALLGLTDEATDEEIEAAAKKQAEAKTETADDDDGASEEIKALAVKIGELEKSLKIAGEAGDLKVLSAKFESRIEALEKRNDTLARQAIREKALREGKIVPLSADDLTLAQFEKLVGELPANQVPLDQRTPEGVKALSSTGLGRSNGAEEEVRKNLNITKENWEKHNA